MDERKRKEDKAAAARRYWEKRRHKVNKERREATARANGVGVCPLCGEVFVRTRKNKVYCTNSCAAKASYRRNREQILARQREWRRAHAEEINAKKREWRREHPLQASALDRKYREAARAKALEGRSCR